MTVIIRNTAICLMKKGQNLTMTILLLSIEGHTIYKPVYDFSIHNRVDKTVKVEPKRVILIEGILIFENKELRDLMDIKIFVDTDADERLMRRIIRDMKYRGRTIDSILTQYQETVKPMHEEFV